MSNIEEPASGLNDNYLISNENAESDDGDGDDDTDIDPNELEDIFGNIDGFTDDIDLRKNPLLWVQTQISRNINPRSILQELVPNIVVPDGVNDFSVWRLIFEIITEPSPRKRLLNVSTLRKVVDLIRDCKNILVLTGAGVSVSCGIPDFRSRNGIYARLHEEYPDLPDPQAMFDIHYFRNNPCPFFRFAKAIYPGRFTPSISHYFIRHLEKTGRLLRNYTQNIDTLEQVAGINNVVTCHGSFSNATCMNCKLKVKASEIEEDVFAQAIPFCKQCSPGEGALNILKPDIVFFGEGLPEEFHRTIEKDKVKADLLIVIGSSLKVRPVALIPSFLKPEIPQILINREHLPHMQFDVELYGNCDDIIVELCKQLGDDWTDFSKSFSPTPVDFEKYKSLIENRPAQNNMPIEIPSSGKMSKKTLHNKISKENNVMSENDGDDNEIAIQQGPSCYSSFTNTAISNPLLTDESPERKKVKLSSNKKADNMHSDYYMFYPPNRYIFNGAELNCPGDSDDENDYSDNCPGGNNYIEDNNEITAVSHDTINLAAHNNSSVVKTVSSHVQSTASICDNFSKDTLVHDQVSQQFDGNIHSNSSINEVST